MGSKAVISGSAPLLVLLSSAPPARRLIRVTSCFVVVELFKEQRKDAKRILVVAY